MTERPDLERIKQSVFRLQTSNVIVRDLEAVVIYALAAEARIAELEREVACLMAERDMEHENGARLAQEAREASARLCERLAADRDATADDMHAHREYENSTRYRNYAEAERSAAVAIRNAR